MTSQVGDYVSKFCQTVFYFCGVGEAGADPPPNPSHAAGKRQLIFQGGDHTRIFVSVQEVERERQPLPCRNYSDQIQEEDEQIVSLP